MSYYQYGSYPMTSVPWTCPVCDRTIELGCYPNGSTDHRKQDQHQKDHARYGMELPEELS